jgi:uncharacterized repeat protein (TIGR03803 family)
MALPALSSRSAAQTPRITTLYAFDGYVASGDGIEPNSAVVAGRGGVLYGTTYYGGASNYGTVFSLSPPPSTGGSWRETQIHVFTGGTDGLEPTALVLGSDGVLYGVTAGGGSGCGTGCGTAFSLTPPPDSTSPDSSWTKNTYEFGASIVLPGSLRSAGGVLYGTSLDGGISQCDAYLGCGALFALAPPTASAPFWTAKVLYSFPNGGGNGPVMTVLGRDGVFYGTSQGGNPNCPFGCGLAFSLIPPDLEGKPPGGAWTENVLHTFIDRAYDGDGVAGLVIGRGPNGCPVLYGVTSGGGIYGYGTAFSLTPPAQPGDSWTERILYNFNGPDGAAFPNPTLAIGHAGVIYGTSYGISGGGPAASGAVFSLAPPSDESGAWTMNVLHSFTGGDDGGNPIAGVVIGDDGVLYGSTTTGGGTGKFGTVFALRP